MADEPVNKWEALVAKLLQLTQEGAIKWQAGEPPTELLRAKERTSVVYTTSYLGQHLRIYEYENKYWMDEDRFEWSGSVRLEFTDPSGRANFEIPGGGVGQWDLLRAVQHQTSNVDAFLEKLGIS